MAGLPSVEGLVLLRIAVHRHKRKKKMIIIIRALYREKRDDAGRTVHRRKKVEARKMAPSCERDAPVWMLRSLRILSRMTTFAFSSLSIGYDRHRAWADFLRIEMGTWYNFVTLPRILVVAPHSACGNTSSTFIKNPLDSWKCHLEKEPRHSYQLDRIMLKAKESGIHLRTSKY